MWCIPPEQDAAFVCQMESVLEVYQRPYDPRYPVICMDEQPKQLLRDKHHPVPANAEHPERIDHEYIREGTCCIWMFTEPLAGWRDVNASPRRTSLDWAHHVQAIVDQERYQDAEEITLVCDNLNTHKLSAFYEAFEPQEARRLARKVKLVHTPKHGSWLNMAEPELSVLTRQCLNTRIATQEEVEKQVKAWTARRNQQQIGVNWQFSTEDARIKLKRLYPKIEY